MSEGHVCAQCGEALDAADAFCWNCGTEIHEKVGAELAERRRRLSQSSIVDGQCRSCNGPLRSSDRYCVECGARREGTPTRPGEGGSSFDRLREKLEEVASDEFEIVGEVGRGGMGAVYLARDLNLGRPVAIKVLFPRFVTDESMLDRFRNEARLVASLRHRNIVNLQSSPAREDLQFFVMDYIEGASLEKIIRSEGPLPLPVVRCILYDIGSALSYAHAQGRGVIHRDIKPSNIMLDSEGNAVVTDFGISKAINRSQGFTQTGAIIGTPEYMSPEQCRGETLTPAADQYALGVVAYAMLTGTPPFSGQHMDVLISQVSDLPPPIRERREDCPPEVEEGVLRMLAKSPDDRWPDVRAAVRGLGCRYQELGDPVRMEIGRLATDIAGHARLARPVAEVSLSQPPRVVTPGDRFSLDAVPLDELGKELEGREVVWSSTDPKIVGVQPDGTSEARAEGRAWVRAECEGHEALVEVVVAAASVAELVVSGVPSEIRAGDEVELVATPLDQRGRELEDREVRWSSSDSSVAFVSGGGRVEAVASGTVEIVAECEGVSARQRLEVLEPRVHNVSLRQAPPALHPDDTFQLSVAVLDARGQVLEGRRLEWSVADEEVGSVSPEGLLRARSPGRTTVTVRCEGVESSDELVVKPRKVEGIRISTPPGELRPGRRVEMTATPLDGRGRALDTRDIAWSTSDPRVAFVTAHGIVEAVAPGSVEIAAECEGKKAAVELEVLEPAVASLWLSAGPGLIRPGDSFTLEVAVLDERGQKLKDREVEWEARPRGVVEVSKEGEVRAVGPGRVRVTARCEGVQEIADLTVQAASEADTATRVLGAAGLDDDAPVTEPEVDLEADTLEIAPPPTAPGPTEEETRPSTEEATPEPLEEVTPEAPEPPTRETGEESAPEIAEESAPKPGEGPPAREAAERPPEPTPPTARRPTFRRGRGSRWEPERSPRPERARPRSPAPGTRRRARRCPGPSWSPGVPSWRWLPERSSGRRGVPRPSRRPGRSPQPRPPSSSDRRISPCAQVRRCGWSPPTGTATR